MSAPSPEVQADFLQIVSNLTHRLEKAISGSAQFG
jgi:hypothetical protein